MDCHASLAMTRKLGGFFVLPVAAETAVLCGLAGFRVAEGFDGEEEVNSPASDDAC
jgi:hypothetical protein